MQGHRDPSVDSKQDWTFTSEKNATHTVFIAKRAFDTGDSKDLAVVSVSDS